MKRALSSINIKANFEVLYFVKMCPIFDGSMLTYFEKYEKITRLPLIWTKELFHFGYLSLNPFPPITTNYYFCIALLYNEHAIYSIGFIAIYSALQSKPTFA